MVTGDNPLTACHVSDLLGITRKDAPILVFTPPNELGRLLLVIIQLMASGYYLSPAIVHILGCSLLL